MRCTWKSNICSSRWWAVITQKTKKEAQRCKYGLYSTIERICNNDLNWRQNSSRGLQCKSRRSGASEKNYYKVDFSDDGERLVDWSTNLPYVPHTKVSISVLVPAGFFSYYVWLKKTPTKNQFQLLQPLPRGTTIQVLICPRASPSISFPLHCFPEKLPRKFERSFNSKRSKHYL